MKKRTFLFTSALAAFVLILYAAEPRVGTVKVVNSPSDKVVGTVPVWNGTTYIAGTNGAGGGSGTVVGPGTVVDGDPVGFDGTTGNSIKPLAEGAANGDFFLKSGDVWTFGHNGSTLDHLQAPTLEGLIPAASLSGVSASMGALTVPSITITGSGPNLIAYTFLTTNNTCSGIIFNSMTNSGGVTQWDAVFINSSGFLVKADANGAATFPVAGLVLATTADTETVTLLLHGVVRNDSWTWTPGGTLYLSKTPGVLTQTAPTTSADTTIVTVIGKAVTATHALIRPSQDFGTAP